MSGCSVYNCAGAFFNYVQTSDSFIRNNAIYGFELVGTITCPIDHNVTNYIYSTHWGADEIIADPLFINKGAGDLRLASGSPCINAGLP